MGACGGVLATSVHFLNQKLVKKPSVDGEEGEAKKSDPIEYAKIFVLMTLLVGGTVFFMNKKSSLLKKKLLGGGSSTASAPGPAAPAVAQVPVQPVRNVGAQVPVNRVSAAARPTPNMQSVNLNMNGGGQTISSSVNPGIELSDINDVIHTGIPNF